MNNNISIYIIIHSEFIFVVLLKYIQIFILWIVVKNKYPIDKIYIFIVFKIRNCRANKCRKPQIVVVKISDVLPSCVP